MIWGFTVEAEEGDRVLIDATPFFLRDAHSIPETLANEKQGSYSLDDKRSAIYPDRTKNFPLNTEVEALLTFAGKDTGPTGWSPLLPAPIRLPSASTIPSSRCLTHR